MEHANKWKKVNKKRNCTNCSIKILYYNIFVANILETNDNNFNNDVLMEGMPVLVFFKTEWCPVCRQINPIVELTADIYTNKVKFVKIDATNNPNISIKNNVLAVPTLIFFRYAKETARSTGFMQENDLKAFIDKNLASG